MPANIVIDTSAILAVLLDEPEKQAVVAATMGATSSRTEIGGLLGDAARVTACVVAAQRARAVPMAFVASAGGEISKPSGRWRSRVNPCDASRDDTACWALLSKLGRRREALDAAWRDFQEHPSTYSYNDLMMHVPRGERSQWHERANEAPKGGDDLATLLELLIATREVTQPADVVRERDHAALAKITHYVTEPAAMRLTTRHPDAAARLWCALGSRIANAKKSKYYDMAIAHVARARQCYVRAGLGAAWEQVVRQIRADHCRKVGFISDVERVATGSGPRREPPFLERAKTKWRQRRRAGVP
jgi:PIN domain nuclease of toxin-antitoxin system